MTTDPGGELEAARRRETVLAGGRSASSPPRAPVAASWRRAVACGLEPGSAPELPPLGAADLERRRHESGLADHVPQLVHHLAPVVDAGQMVVVADPEGRVLWRAGASGVRRAADDLGFVAGSAWTEGNVGTNAIGTALVLGEAVHIAGPEHFCDSHTRWGCAAAPLRDPWTGRTMGVLDVSGPSREVHPAELALVRLAARLTTLQVVEQHRHELDQLRAVAAPLLARLEGDVLAVDRFGHLAAAIGSRTPERVALPAGLAGGELWLPTLGETVAEPLAGGGWLLRLGRRGRPLPGATEVVLDLTGEPVCEVACEGVRWSRALSRRHAELLLALARSGVGGRTAADLAADLFADRTRAVTVRAELSRLRRTLGAVLASSPYRFAPGVAVRLRLPTDPAVLLPGSSAPAVLEVRAGR